MNEIQGLKETVLSMRKDQEHKEQERRSVEINIKRECFLKLRELRLNVQERKIKQDEKEPESKKKEMEA